MKRANFKYLFISIILILSLSLLSGCFYIETPTPPSSPQPAPAPPPSPPINPQWTPPPSENGADVLPSIADVVAQVKPSVVAISTEIVTMDFFNRPFTQKGAGSGWIIDENGIIVTNNHVVTGAQTITATLDDGRTFTVDTKTIFTDPLNDLAIFKIDAQNLPAVKIGDSTRLRIGDWVVVIGNSLGLGTSAKQGIVSRHGVNMPISQGQTLNDLVETSAAINPGNSGGPLVNLAGEVVGITSAKIAAAGVEGMGYAISTETAIPVIEELIKNGYVIRPWLGVNLYTVDQLAIRQYDLKVKKGILIYQIVSGSPADKAGIKEGDVIVSIGSKEVAAVQELTRVLHKSKIGQPVEIIFWRGNEQLTTAVIPAESPPPP
ncbi:S1C family serine protease [Chloroflexota bacterium]